MKRLTFLTYENVLIIFLHEIFFAAEFFQFGFVGREFGKILVDLSGFGFYRNRAPAPVFSAAAGIGIAKKMSLLSKKIIHATNITVIRKYLFLIRLMKRFI
jgi:hypothetical protein